MARAWRDMTDTELVRYIRDYGNSSSAIEKLQVEFAKKEAKRRGLLIEEIGDLSSLEDDLAYISDQTHATPYVAYAKVKKALAQYGFHLAAEDQFIDLNDEDAVFFQLDFAGAEESEPLFLTMEFDDNEDGFFDVDINIVTEEDLNTFIGDDEVEEL